MEYILLPIIFALLNRARGDHFKYFPDTAAKYSTGALCGSLIWYAGGDWWSIPICMLLYKIGESFGWGKWIGSILTNRPQYNQDEGKTVVDIPQKNIVWKIKIPWTNIILRILSFTTPKIHFIIWDGIHHIANFFIPERKNFYDYSLLALAIRGIYWWGPILIYAMIILPLNSLLGLLYIGFLGLLFPISELLAMQWDWKIKPFIHSSNMPGRSWERAEIIYGVFQGLVFSLLL